MPMDPNLRAKNFKELMARLAVEPYEFGEMAGLARSQIDRIEAGDSMWNSKAMNRKAAAGMGMTVEQMEAFLDDRMPLKQAVDMARPAIVQGRAMLQQKKALQARVNAAALKYERTTGEEIVAGLKLFAAQFLWEMAGAATTEELIRQTVAELQHEMSGLLERGRAAKGPPPDPSPPVQRSGPKASGGSHSRRSRPH